MKIILQFLSSLAFSIILGIVGLFIGAHIGGNFGFPSFGGNYGYEAGGAFFALLGISFGSLVGIRVANKLQKNPQKYLLLTVITVAVFVLQMIVVSYGMSRNIGLVLLLLPTIVLVLAINYQRFFKVKKNQSDL